MKLKITTPAGPDRNPAKPTLAGGRLLETFSAKHGCANGNFLRSSPKAPLSPKGAVRSHARPETSLPASPGELVVYPALFVTDFPSFWICSVASRGWSRRGKLLDRCANWRR